MLQQCFMSGTVASPISTISSARSTKNPKFQVLPRFFVRPFSPNQIHMRLVMSCLLLSLSCRVLSRLVLSRLGLIVRLISLSCLFCGYFFCTLREGPEGDVFREFLTETAKIPAWADADKIARGQRIHCVHTPFMGLSLFSGSLVGGAQFSTAAIVTALAGNITTDPTRRINETGIIYHTPHRFLFVAFWSGGFFCTLIFLI
jgi:hypothetical protein